MFGSFPPSPLVGLRLQSLLGPGSRHCYGIITLEACGFHLEHHETHNVPDSRYFGLVLIVLIHSGIRHVVHGACQRAVKFPFSLCSVARGPCF